MHSTHGVMTPPMKLILLPPKSCAHGAIHHMHTGSHSLSRGKSRRRVWRASSSLNSEQHILFWKAASSFKCKLFIVFYSVWQYGRFTLHEHMISRTINRTQRSRYKFSSTTDTDTQQPIYTLTAVRLSATNKCRTSAVTDNKKPTSTTDTQQSQQPGKWMPDNRQPPLESRQLTTMKDDRLST
jgi:hypothetical protein